MKKIGIFTRITDYNNKDILYIPKAFYDVLKDKADIIMIPFDEHTKLEDKYSILNYVDGVILPGGDDIYNFELKLTKYLYDNDIPTLGVCLGMQTLATYFNGQLGTLSTLNHKSKDKYVHSISINKDSMLYDILKKDSIMVNSRHKDYIIKTDLFVGAKAEDIIEEVEDKTKRFFMGVQWHPENLDDEDNQKLFEYFIKKL